MAVDDFAETRTVAVPLVDACVTEWRRRTASHSRKAQSMVPLVDACVTEWRPSARGLMRMARVPLVDACVTEWRRVILRHASFAQGATR